jgi:hypothetical protein
MDGGNTRMISSIIRDIKAEKAKHKVENELEF